MQDMNGLKPILDCLLERHGFDFTGYHPAMLERRIGQRLAAVNCDTYQDYHSHLVRNEEEIDALLDAITINVSQFFRDPLTFELLADRILPDILLEKVRSQESSLRVWSAGCAMGEEPYSVAILISELLEKDTSALNLHIFATDIDPKALHRARTAVYERSSVEDVKYGLLTKYFTAAGDAFRLNAQVSDRVTFSSYDMLDTKHRVPPDSIFGNFDLVLCRNLLIYFNTERQIHIFSRLYHALAPGGYLVLGEAEAPMQEYRHAFNRVTDFCPIYRKR